MLAALVELKARAGDEILHRLRDEHFSPARQSRDARADRDGDAGDLALVQLALARVDARANLEPELAHAVHDRVRAANRPRGPVERREETVAGGVLLVAAEPGQLAPHEGVVPVEQLPPGVVAESSGPLGRTDDVREHQRREHGVGNFRCDLSGHEALDLLGELRRQEDAPPIVPGDSLRPRGRNALRDVERVRLVVLPFAVEHDRRHPHRRQNLTEVGITPGSVHGVRDRRARTDANPVHEPLALFWARHERRRIPGQHLVAELLRAPPVAERGERLLPFPHVVLRKMNDRVEERERARPLRIRRREERRHRTTVLRAEKHRARRPDGVEDGAHVVHACLQCGELPAVVGEARPPLVEQDHAERSREALVEAAPVRRLPPEDEVREIVRDVDEVDIAVTDDLVRDRHVSAAGIADVRFHDPSFLDLRRGDNGR